MFEKLRNRLTEIKERFSGQKDEAEPERTSAAAQGTASAPKGPPAPPPARADAPPRPAPAAPRKGGPANPPAAEAEPEHQRATVAVRPAAARSIRAEREDAFEGGLLKRKLGPEEVEELLSELELALYEGDIAQETVEAMKATVKQELDGAKVGFRDSESLVSHALRIAVENALPPDADFDATVDGGARPFIIMFVGINGTGKTTTIARIAHRIKKRGMTPVIAAGDTFRAGAIDQLEVHATRLGVKLIKNQPGSDPAAVAYDAVEHAKARHKEVVLVDTAGRMQTNAGLMDEMKKIKRVAKPHLTIFVGDAWVGNDAVDQATAFDKAVGVDGVVLTKIDTDAKGGAALSIAHAIGKPIFFVGVGQGYDDLVPFSRQWMVERIFGGQE